MVVTGVVAVVVEGHGGGRGHYSSDVMMKSLFVCLFVCCLFI